MNVSPSPATCSSRKLLISCDPNAEDGDLRLVERSANYQVPMPPLRNRGFLEVFYNGEWGTVCKDNFDYISARVACRQLGYVADKINFTTAPTNNRAYRNSPVQIAKLQCRGGESQLAHCSHTLFGRTTCRHSDDVILNCDLKSRSVEANNTIRQQMNNDIMKNHVRLTGSTVGETGFVEVLNGLDWEPVCSNKIDPFTASVVCKQIGFSYLNSAPLPGVSYSFLTSRQSSSWSDEKRGFKCIGNETNLFQCSPSQCGMNLDGAISCIGHDIGSATNAERFKIAVSMNDKQGIDRLLQQGVSANERLERCCDDRFVNGGLQNSSALICATCYASSSAVNSLLRYGANVRDTDPALGGTSLHWAAMGGFPEIAKILVRFGTRVDATTNTGRTALHEAASTNNLEIAEILIGAGANAFIRDQNGKTPIDEADGRGKMMAFFKSVERGAGLRQEFLRAIIDGNESKVTRLLEHPFNLNPDSILDKCCFFDGAPALVCATCMQRVDIVQLLLRKGANVDLTDFLYGSTAVSVAARNGNIQLIHMLIASGADVNISTRAKYTPLMYAAMFGYYDVVRYLVNDGANVEAVDYRQRTAEDFATQNGYLEIAHFLNRRG